MKKIFLLSKKNIELAKQEVLALTKRKNFDLIDNLLILQSHKEIASRLAYTHSLYRFLFECEKKDFEKQMASFDWNSFYEDNFCLRIHGNKFSEKEFAKYIWQSVKKPKVNLRNPATLIEVFVKDKKVVCGKFLESIEKGFIKRRPHLRPGFHPSSLNPRLARACINLIGMEKGETLLDPFCGTGGILIEARLMKLKAVGYDISDEMLDRARKNLKFYNINARLEKANALEIKKSFDYIVTDLPYGRSTGKIADLEKFYSDFLEVLEKILKKKALIIFPNYVDWKKLVKKTSLKLIHHFNFYIHKSLSKEILVLEKP